jgi:hypothetical protein
MRRGGVLWRQHVSLSMLVSRRPAGALTAARFSVDEIPLTRNATSVFRRKGGESPNTKGGAGVKDVRRGGATSAQARLCERGFASAEDGEGPRQTPQGILYSAGDAPPFFLRERARGGDSRPAGPER